MSGGCAVSGAAKAAAARLTRMTCLMSISPVHAQGGSKLMCAEPRCGEWRIHVGHEPPLLAGRLAYRQLAHALRGEWTVTALRRGGAHQKGRRRTDQFRDSHGR